MTPQPAAAAKTERLLNLVIALLSTRRPLTKTQLRTAVPQYHQTASDEAFDRMFERDKDELRELGIPLVTALVAAAYDDELGYRIDRREYQLPEISFEPREVAALALAGRVWSHASLAAPARAALAKLAAAGVELDDSSLVGIEPRVRTTEPSFDAVRRAVAERREITFGYRRADGQAATRRLQPWGMTQWRGRWYVTGLDHDRGAERVFRLGRIDGAVRAVGERAAYEIPEGHIPKVAVSTSVPAFVDQPPAVLRLRTGAGNTLRRRARTVGEVDDTWVQIDVDYRNIDSLAQEVAGFGPDVVVEAPDTLRDAVVRLLAAARDRHTGVAAHPGGMP
ncbi:MAG: WYL domain-containing protein [Candidatus Phosphoribacter sp.]